MADVNPVVLVAAGTVAAGVIAFVACMRGSRENKKERKPSAPAKEEAPAVAATKPKKRSKPRNKAKKSSEGKDVPGSSSEVEPAVAVAASTAPAAAPAAEEPNSDDDNGDDDADDFFLKRDAAKKPKKTKESQEQKASRLERQKQQKNAKKAEDDVVFFTDSNAAPTTGGKYGDYSQGTTNSAYDGWAVVENPRKLKKKSESTSDLEDLPALTPSPVPTTATAAPPNASAAASAGAAPAPAPVEVEEPTPSPPVDLVTKELTVEAKKLGLLIGPKGVTKIGMQTATGTEIAMPKVEKDFVGPVTISVTGTAEGVDRAIAALSELCTKGYSTLLASPDFHESYVEVKPKYLPDIIGKGGSSIRAIQAHTGVKISTPSDYVRVLPSGETITPSKVKIILAGTRDKIAVARGLILDLCKYYYTPVTHPGLTHAEMDIDSRYYNYIIGSKGSEIKHIQANYKVTVHIPNAETANQNLLIVGEASNVANAEKHIHRLIEKVDERAKAEAEGIALGENAKARIAAAAAANGSSGAESSAPARRERGPRAPRGDRDRSSPAVDAPAARGPKDPNAPDAEDEAWTAEYAPRRAPIDLNAMLPATAKFSAAPAPASPTPAASTPDAAEL